MAGESGMKSWVENVCRPAAARKVVLDRDELTQALEAGDLTALVRKVLWPHYGGHEKFQDVVETFHAAFLSGFLTRLLPELVRVAGFASLTTEVALDIPEQTPEELLGCDATVISRWWRPLPGDVCLDIGTGPGYWALEAARRGAFCYAFSPGNEDMRLAAAASIEQGLSLICLVPAALWSRSGSLPLGSHGSLIGADGKDTLVPVTTLDEWAAACHLVRLDWVNMDCEGAELEVIQGGKATLMTHRPRMFIEVHEGMVDRTELKKLILTLGPYAFQENEMFLIAEPTAAVTA